MPDPTTTERALIAAFTTAFDATELTTANDPTKATDGGDADGPAVPVSPERHRPNLAGGRDDA